MAPGRQRGANKAKAATELGLGDLVLAKVKGFPAWPAKVSRPEDWKRARDPKKYFLQFFGTQELAFIAPADVEAFTSESKSKLLGRCKGKTIKYFPQAVKEICEAFEELKHGNLGGTSDNSDTSPRRDAADAEGGKVNGQAELYREQELSITAEESRQFSDFPEMFKRLIKDGTLAPKESGASAHSPIVPSSVKYETKSIENQADKKSANGNKAKDITIGSKRKIEVASGRNGKRASRASSKSELNISGTAMKNQLKDQKHLGVGKSQKDTVSDPSEHGDGGHSKQKRARIVREQSQSTRKPKHVALRSNAERGPIFRNGKSSLVVHTRDDEAVSDVESSPENKRSYGSATYKNDVPKKRRAVHLYVDDDEVQKTPVPKVGSSAVISVSTKRTDQNNEVSGHHGDNLRGSSGDGSSFKDCFPSGKLVSEMEDNSLKAQASHSPGVEDLEKQLLTLRKSPVVNSVNKLIDQQKPNKPFFKGSTTAPHSKAYIGSAKDPNLFLGSLDSSHIQVSTQKSRQLLSVERPKGTPKMSMKLNEPASLVDSQRDQYTKEVGRMEAVMDKSGSSVDPKAGHSSTSMKLLIAAAQAKRRQAQMQNAPHGRVNSVLAPTMNFRGRSPSPSSAGQVFLPGGANETALDAVGVHSRASFGSPSRVSFALQNQPDTEELEDKGLSLTQQDAGSTLSGDTEVAVARDTFEGMIETLSRTKESIGRATRLAIDCAKYGIANEVVDLLMRKLENEATFHRKVDLFFLVDSITQCSHSKKGIAEASFIPAVQAALPRLLGAAAPPGASAQENRRQCLKVLRLWLSREIFPKSVLQRFMDDINDDLSSGLSFRRPSRAERSVNDPIKEMEGMLVDEYGSNATFNLPGFLSSRGFVDDEEDEEDVPSNCCKESDASQSEDLNASAGIETGKVTLVDRQQHILEDVDGELKMEDVTGYPKDRAVSPGHLSKKEHLEMHVDTGLGSSSNNVFEPHTPEGSPPLPLEPPPPLPPLPSSPYPPPPPPLSSSSPPPPPPPPLSSSSPPPPPPPPPLLPSLPSQPPPLPLLPSGPAQAVPPRVLLQPPSVFPPGQAPLPVDYSIPIGSQPVQMAGNTSQQVPCFLPAGGCGSHDQSAYSFRPLVYGQRDMYAGPQSSLSKQQFQNNQQFQPCQMTFAQRPFSPVPVPQPPSNHFVYNKPSVQQHMPHPPPHPPSHLYPSASHSEGLRRFSDEQLRSAAVEFKADNVHNTWVNGGRMPACPLRTFAGEAAYFRLAERPLANNVGYQMPAPNTASGGPSTSGRSINQMVPHRPNMSAHDCWGPV